MERLTLVLFSVGLVLFVRTVWAEGAGTSTCYPCVEFARGQERPGSMRERVYRL